MNTASLFVLPLVTACAGTSQSATPPSPPAPSVAAAAFTTPSAEPVASAAAADVPPAEAPADSRDDEKIAICKSIRAKKQ